LTAKIITVFNEKGGAGKTTVAVHIAGTLGKRGERVKLVDIDPQNTSSRWVAQAKDHKEFPARIANLSALAANLHREMRHDMESFDYIVVDCPPSSESPAANSALTVSDLAVIPVVPSPNDLWAVATAKRLVTAAMRANPHLHGVTVMNMVQRTTLAAIAVEELGKDKDIPLLKTQLGLRSAYKECPLLGGTVHDVRRAKDAVAEVESMVDELLAHLNAEVTKGAKR
jgi:chromosome partitioning protein